MSRIVHTLGPQRLLSEYEKNINFAILENNSLQYYTCKFHKKRHSILLIILTLFTHTYFTSIYLILFILQVQIPDKISWYTTSNTDYIYTYLLYNTFIYRPNVTYMYKSNLSETGVRTRCTY